MIEEMGAPTGHRATRRERKRRGKGCIAVVLAMAVLLGLGGFAVVQVRAWLEELTAPPEDFSGPGHGHVQVAVQPGDTSADIGDALMTEGVVASSEAFVEEARDEPEARLIQAGYYDMKLEMSAKAALQRMLDPKSMINVGLTIPEGLTVGQTLQRIADESPLELDDLRAVTKNSGQLKLPGYARGRAEGYLFPATYDVTPGTTARSLLRDMVNRFDQAADTVKLEKGARQRGMSPAQVVTVASIIQREASRSRDLPKVARVIYNRLKQGRQLEMDSTVHYATGAYNQVATTKQQREIDSPYNTYQRRGLPPGPIAAPGEEALKAALNPASGDWIFFVTVNIKTGETKFASTEREHQRNVAEYQRHCRSSPLC